MKDIWTNFCIFHAEIWKIYLVMHPVIQVQWSGCSFKIKYTHFVQSAEADTDIVQHS